VLGVFGGGCVGCVWFGLVKIGGGVFVEFLGTEYNLPIIN